MSNNTQKMAQRVLISFQGTCLSSSTTPVATLWTVFIIGMNATLYAARRCHDSVNVTTHTQREQNSDTNVLPLYAAHT